jgi:hypothetical protein
VYQATLPLEVRKMCAMDVGRSTDTLRSYAQDPSSVSAPDAVAAALLVLAAHVGTSREGSVGWLVPDSAKLGGRAALAATRCVAHVLLNEGATAAADFATPIRSFNAIHALSTFRLPENSQEALQALHALESTMNGQEPVAEPSRWGGIKLDPRIATGVTNYLRGWVNEREPTLHKLSNRLNGSIRGVRRLEAVEFIRRREHFKDWTALTPFQTLVVVLTLEAAANGDWDGNSLIAPPNAAKPNAIKQFNERALVSSDQVQRAKDLDGKFRLYPVSCQRDFGNAEYFMGEKLGTILKHLSEQWDAVSK